MATSTTSPILSTGDDPEWGEPAEIFTLHGEPFSRITSFQSAIGVSDALEAGRFDIFSGDNAGNVEWARYYGKDAAGRPVYDTPRKLKQHNPHVNGGYFSVPTAGDWRDTGMQDILVGSVEGYIFWYKTLSTNPLRFAPPERVRYGTTEIRRLATPYPSSGQYWGGSQSPYDGDTGGYSNPVLADWNGNGLLDLVVCDMVSLYEWYPNWGTKTTPELGPPERLHINDGSPLIGPWRQQPGIGHLTDGDLPDIVTQDLDLDVALYRRVGSDDLSDPPPRAKNSGTRTAPLSRRTASTPPPVATVAAGRSSTSSTGTATASSTCSSASAPSMEAPIAAATSSSPRTWARRHSRYSRGRSSSCSTPTATPWSSGGMASTWPPSTGKTKATSA